MSRVSEYKRSIKASKLLMGMLMERNIPFQVSYAPLGRVINTANTTFVLVARQDNVIEGFVVNNGQRYELLATDDTLEDALSRLFPQTPGSQPRN